MGVVAWWIWGNYAVKLGASFGRIVSVSPTTRKLLYISTFVGSYLPDYIPPFASRSMGHPAPTRRALYGRPSCAAPVGFTKMHPEGVRQP
jgi:hypothetical protein